MTSIKNENMVDKNITTNEQDDTIDAYFEVFS